MKTFQLLSEKAPGKSEKRFDSMGHSPIIEDYRGMKG